MGKGRDGDISRRRYLLQEASASTQSTQSEGTESEVPGDMQRAVSSGRSTGLSEVSLPLLKQFIEI